SGRVIHAGACSPQPGSNLRQMPNSHVEHNCLTRTCQSAPVERLVIEGMAGHECNTLCQTAMGQRNVCRRGRAQRRCDSRDYHVRDAMCCQDFNFLTAAPEDERIAAFEPGHAQTEPRIVYEQLVDSLLGGMVAGLLSDKHALCIPAGALENRLW